MKARDFKTLYAVTALMLAGVAMRVFGAWCFAEAHTADHGIICLMVKHILAGSELPVFFYGLPYMGAIEPYASALLCRLFGMTGFMINMGTALFGILLFPVVYFWGRDAAGKTAGLAALAFCVVGPEFYFQFQSWADGGYAAIVLLDALILWVGVRILNKSRAEGDISLVAHILLGLLAGLCWFQSPLTIAAILTLALLYLAVLRLRVFSWRLVWAGLAFIFGSLPLWLWNLRNGWQTFDMLESQGRPSFLHGLKLYYVDRLFKLLDLDGANPFVFWLLLGIYILAAAVCISLLLYNLVRRRMEDGDYHLLAAVLFIVISSILFTRSHLALAPAARYLIPIIPPLAVILGLATACAAQRIPKGLAWIPLIILIAYQSPMLPKGRRDRLKCEAFAARAHQFAGFLERENIDCIYTKYQVPRANHGLNFLLGERFVFSDLSRERYRPYAEAIENADRVAVLNDLAGFSSFLDASGGGAALGGMDGLELYYNIRPPDRPLLALASENIASIRNGSGADLSPVLTDGDLATSIDLNPAESANSSLTVDLGSVRAISSMRLQLPPNVLPSRITVAVAQGEGDWREIKRVDQLGAYFWSGPRFFWGGDSFRIEFSFAEAAARQVKLDFEFASADQSCPLSELQLFGPDGNEADAGQLPAELLAFLNQHAIEAVYADRWLSNKLRQTLGDDVAVVESAVFQGGLPRRMLLSRNTALVVARKDAPQTARVLETAWIETARASAGGWDVFYFEQDDWRERYAEYPGLYWCGYAPLMIGDKLLVVHCSFEAGRLLAAGETDAARSRLEKALEIYPDYQPAMKLMSELMQRIGDTQAAEKYREKYRRAREPGIDCPANFKNGISFLGLTVDKTEIGPGGEVNIRYYWRVPEDLDHELLAVFVHFKAEEQLLFQDDHVLLAGVDTSEQGFDEVFVEDRQLRVPDDIPAERITCDMGIYERTGANLRVGFDSDAVQAGFRMFRIPMEINPRRDGGE